MSRFSLHYRDLTLEELEEKLTSMIRNDPHIKVAYVRFAILSTPNPDILAHMPYGDYQRNVDNLESVGLTFLKMHGVIKHRQLTRIK